MKTEDDIGYQSNTSLEEHLKFSIGPLNERAFFCLQFVHKNTDTYQLPSFIALASLE